MKTNTINNKQYYHQLRAHHNCLSKYDDYLKQSRSIVQSESDNGSYKDYSEKINEINNYLTAINTRLSDIDENITEINNYISQILKYIQDNKPSQGTTTEETVKLSILPPTARSISSTELQDTEPMNTDALPTPNTVAFDSLLADVEDMTIEDMDEFYNKYISPVIAQNGYNLLAPIPVSDLCSCTRIPENEQDKLTWDSLEGDDFTESKRAYIMQFILANRSNSTRAMYLTNKLIGSFALPL